MKKGTALKTILVLVIVITCFQLIDMLNKAEGQKFTIDENTYHYNIGKAVKSSHPEDYIEESWITDLIQEEMIDTLIVVEASEEFKKMTKSASKNSWRKPVVSFED
jgi:hypothetical protein